MVRKVIERIKSKWMAKTTAEKIDFVIDLVTMIGSSAIGASASHRFGAGHKKITKVCVGITCSGLSLAIGDTASKALKANYGAPAAQVIDAIKEAKKHKEETANE